jgi:MOSC domain-containing protein YiiM
MATLIQINTKEKVDGEVGLPKHPISHAQITKSGVGNDFNNYRYESKNNTPDRAVLIYTTDKIKELNNEGWPIQPGDIGENFLLDGLKYADLNIGSTLRVGEVQLEISEICNPCKNLSALDYVGKDRITEFIQTMKGRRGWYCRVLKEGNVATGDPVHID